MKGILCLSALIFAAILGIAEFQADYQYDKTVGSYWDLSEKASTLQQKSAYLDQYVAAVAQPGQFAACDATIFQTPTNCFEQNMVALKSLQGRMHQIQGMDETSFAYQTAIQQITGQEQGEGQGVTDVFRGCWYLENKYLLWSWHGGLLWLFLVGFPLAFAGVWSMVESLR